MNGVYTDCVTSPRASIMSKFLQKKSGKRPLRFFKRTSAAVLIVLLSFSSLFVPTHTAYAANTPTLVQHALWQSNENVENGNAFVLTLPNPVLSGNLVVLALTYCV